MKAGPARQPRLLRGQHRRRDGRVVTYFNLQLDPLVKKRLEVLAAKLGEAVGDVVRDALFTVHPTLRSEESDP